MARQVQYQSRVDSLAPVTSVPSPARSGFEAISPVSAPVRCNAQTAVRVSVASSAAVGAALLRGYEAVAPERMPKRPTDPGHLALDLLALPQPPLSKSGFETHAPVRMPRIPTDPGIHADTYRALPQPPLSKSGFETVAPERMPKLPTDPGIQVPPYRALPQPPAPGSGFEALAPERMPRRPTDAGYLALDLRALLRPPQIGFECVGPDRGRRLPTDPGFLALDLRALTQPTAPGAGFEALAPERARRLPIDAGYATFVFPVAQAVANFPNGWYAVAPDVMRRRSTDGGFFADTYRALPQAAAGPGYETIAPDRVVRPQIAPAGSEFLPLNLPPAAPSAVLWGWQTVHEAAVRKRVSPGGHTDYVLVPAAGALDGWQAVYENFVRSRPTRPGHTEFWFQPVPPPPALPYGWVTFAPTHARRLPTDAGLSNLPFLALAQPPSLVGWQVLAPERTPRPQALPGFVSGFIAMPPNRPPFLYPDVIVTEPARSLVVTEPARSLVVTAT